MPKRIVKPYRFEKETERKPLTPTLERRLRKIASARGMKDLEEWRSAAGDADRFLTAPRAAIGAYTLGECALASEIADEALRLAPSFQDSWNYGNAIHFAHTALGLVALEHGRFSDAIDHLRQSAETQGSAQLNSFGPSMRLARELLRQGRSEAVLAYLRQCRSFWAMGTTWLNIWEKKIQRGAMPTFFMQLYR